MLAKMKSWGWALVVLAVLYAVVQNPNSAGAAVRQGFDIVGEVFTGVTSFASVVIGG